MSSCCAATRRRSSGSTSATARASGYESTTRWRMSPLGRGGALRLGYSPVPPEETTVVALNGDILTNQPLSPLLGYHERKRAAATVMLTPLRSPYGIASLDRSGRIVAFAEKPLLPHWINAGVYVLSPEFFPPSAPEGRPRGHRLPPSLRRGQAVRLQEQGVLAFDRQLQGPEGSGAGADGAGSRLSR